jgi:hypothetical protein
LTSESTSFWAEDGAYKGIRPEKEDDDVMVVGVLGVVLGAAPGVVDRPVGVLANPRPEDGPNEPVIGEAAVKDLCLIPNEC